MISTQDGKRKDQKTSEWSSKYHHIDTDVELSGVWRSCLMCTCCGELRKVQTQSTAICSKQRPRGKLSFVDNLRSMQGVEALFSDPHFE